MDRLIEFTPAPIPALPGSQQAIHLDTATTFRFRYPPMKKLTSLFCVLSLINLGALQAGPVESKKPFSSTELLALSEQQVASMKEVREVEAGLLGAASSLINLALYGAILYGGYALSQSISD